MTTMAPGWYPDPSNAVLQRYWDGSTWTGHTQSTPAPMGAPASPLGQDAYYGAQDAIANPHWVLSVLAALVLFPVGLLSLLFSVLCTNATNAGNYEQARRYASYAKKSAIAFIALAVAALVFVAVIAIIGVNSITTVTNDQTAADQTTSIASANASLYLAASTGPSSPVDYATGPNFTSTVPGATPGLEKVTYTYPAGTVTICAPKLASGPAPVLGTTC